MADGGDGTLSVLATNKIVNVPVFDPLYRMVCLWLRLAVDLGTNALNMDIIWNILRNVLSFHFKF